MAREFGIARKTIQKMLRYSVPPGYQRQQAVKRPKLGPWLGVIDAILEEDKARPAKQRHTATRIFERLKAEHGFSGCYTIVKDYIHVAELRSREVFVPLTHTPGEAQADFGEALVVVDGVERKAHFLAMDLPHSDDGFVVAFPSETTEAFLEGHVRAFAYLAGCPRAFSTTTRRLRWLRFWAARSGRRHVPFPSYRATICLPISSGVRPRETIKARSRDWSVMRAGTSWFRFRA